MNTSWCRALVVFSGETGLVWLRWLRPGFRHCFLLLEDESGWLAYEPLVHRTEILRLDIPPAFDLRRWYEERGHVVVETRLFPADSRRPRLGIYSCVEAVKRVLGIQAPLVLTPWQLYRHLCAATADCTGGGRKAGCEALFSSIIGKKSLTHEGGADR
ncbi:hypothetical protein [Telmatospirillum sp. J64-1]|uniref:hypothetical protein n=1 Tax=Telmatospirillum sp. J64-1 TaxID=2502183 RepID=UPI00163DC0F7|nr:hypothetical protein [Telmatospirillum sp. J64-1]